MNAGILAYDGVDDLDLFGVFEVLRKGFESSRTAHSVEIVGVQPFVLSAGGIKIGVTARLPKDVDLLVIPGGPGARKAAFTRAIGSFVLSHRAKRKPIATVCSGALILASLGLIERMRVAIHHEKQSDLEREGSCSAVSGLVQDGWLTSIGGLRSNLGVKATELGFALLAQHYPAGWQAAASRLEVVPSLDLYRVADEPGVLS